MRKIGCEPAEYIPLLLGSGARSDASVANVLRAVRLSGGDIRYGRIITVCAGLWVVARFHAVTGTSSGLLVDHTPREPTSESRTLFALDPAYAPHLNFSDQPRTIRRRVFEISGPVNASGRVSGAVGAGAKGDVAGDGAKREREALAIAIDEYLQLLEDNDAVFIAGPSGRVCTDHARATELDHSIARTLRRLLRLREHQELAGTISSNHGFGG